jgi:heme-degrading monooxygenase HmoA
MTYAFIRDIPINESQYREVQAAIGDETPKGLIAHLVLRQEAGLRYLDVWDSEADWEAFQDERVNPAVRAMMTAHGITPPSTPVPQQAVEVVHAWVS